MAALERAAGPWGLQMRLYLVRHGKPSATWGGDDDDPGLDAAGLEQARSVARRLMNLAPGERPTAVISSPLRRCCETAQPLADALGVAVETDPAVGEIPTPGGLSLAERPAWLRRALGGDWSDIEGDIDYELWRRGVARAVSSRAGAAVFSHFVAINAVVSVLTDQTRAVTFRPDHASVTILEAQAGRLRLISLGDEAGTQVL
jgi:broad specificity phosphatase PhoE